MRKIMLPMTDFGLALLTWLSAVAVRILFLQENAPDFAAYIKFGAVIATLTVISFSRHGLYDSWHFRSRLQEVTLTIQATLAGLLGFILLGYFFADTRISRGTLLIYAILSSFVFLAERFSIRAAVKSGKTQPEQLRIVLVGNGEPIRDYVQTMRDHPHLGIKIIGWIDAPTWAPELNLPAESLRAPTTDEETPAYVVSYTSEKSTLVDRFLKENFNDVTKIFVLPDLKSFALLGLRLQDFAGLPILLLNQPQWSTREILAKRLIDFSGALVGLLLFSPFLLITAIAVKLTSRGPIFFGQERMGLDGQTFKMWKFRTMKPGPAQPGWTIANDPRRTKIGTLLRSTSVDELPQLWNVLVGDMSLVGPRPEQPFYVENFRNEIPAYMLRHKMKAGITGWAQVNGWRGDTSLHKRIECDLFYIRNWSLALDIKILILTVWNGFVNKNAY